MSVHENGPVGDCRLPWCTTPHGRTTHPDDEDHRSAGVLVSVTLNDGHGIVETEVEVGLLRRRGERRSWLVIENGDGVHLELALDSVRRLRATIEADPALDAATIDP